EGVKLLWMKGKTASTRVFTIRAILDNKPPNTDKTWVMEEVGLLTQKHLLLHHTTTDKHGVPPTKRLFKVAMLDPFPEFIGSWGTSGDPGLPIAVRPLQSSASNDDHSL
ncbi:hypothetical protein Tco_0055340, partial [Tanacetum coccineum]